MFRMLVHPSSGASDLLRIYFMGCIALVRCVLVLRCGSAGVVSGLQPRHYSSLNAPNLQHTANQDRNDQFGNQHHSHELLMMGIVIPETY